MYAHYGYRPIILENEKTRDYARIIMDLKDGQYQML